MYEQGETNRYYKETTFLNVPWYSSDEGYTTYILHKINDWRIYIITLQHYCQSLRIEIDPWNMVRCLSFHFQLPTRQYPYPHLRACVHTGCWNEGVDLLVPPLSPHMNQSLGFRDLISHLNLHFHVASLYMPYFTCTLLRIPYGIPFPCGYILSLDDDTYPWYLVWRFWDLRTKTADWGYNDRQHLPHTSYQVIIDLV